MTELDILRAEVTRLRLERDELRDRLTTVRNLLTDTTDRLRERATMNAWAEQRLARHGIPPPDDGNPSF